MHNTEMHFSLISIISNHLRWHFLERIKVLNTFNKVIISRRKPLNTISEILIRYQSWHSIVCMLCASSS